MTHMFTILCNKEGHEWELKDLYLAENLESLQGWKSHKDL